MTFCLSDIYRLSMLPLSFDRNHDSRFCDYFTPHDHVDTNDLNAPLHENTNRLYGKRTVNAHLVRPRTVRPDHLCWTHLVRPDHLCLHRWSPGRFVHAQKWSRSNILVVRHQFAKCLTFAGRSLRLASVCVMVASLA